jgi:hypothetical protein
MKCLLKSTPAINMLDSWQGHYIDQKVAGVADSMVWACCQMMLLVFHSVFPKKELVWLQTFKHWG